MNIYYRIAIVENRMDSNAISIKSMETDRTAQYAITRQKETEDEPKDKNKTKQK